MEDFGRERLDQVDKLVSVTQEFTRLIDQTEFFTSMSVLEKIQWLNALEEQLKEKEKFPWDWSDDPNELRKLPKYCLGWQIQIKRGVGCYRSIFFIVCAGLISYSFSMPTVAFTIHVTGRGGSRKTLSKQP